MSAAQAISLAALATLLVATLPAATAAEGTTSRGWGRYLLETPRLLGDPAGARSRLEQLGISFQLYFNTTLGAKPEGGAHPDGVVRNSGSVDFFTLLDLEALAGVRGLGFLLHVKGSYGRNVNPQVGALADPIDDADFDAPIYVAELFLDQDWFRDRLNVRLGYLDQQTTFDRNAYANTEDIQFMNAALDNNLIVPLKVGFGAVARVRPLDWLTLSIGTNDADNDPRHPGIGTAFKGIDRWMAYLEVAVSGTLKSRRGPLPGALRVGFFRDASRRIRFDSGATPPATSRGHWGAYLNFDQLVYRESTDDLQGLGVFGRWGIADGNENRVRHFWSLGLQYLGSIPGRDRDALGLGVYQAIASSTFREEVDPTAADELGIELYYRWQALPWLALTPGLQYIVNPGGTSANRNAVVLALRGRFRF